MDKLNFDGKEFRIPDIARGAVIPGEMQRLELERERRIAEKKADRRHDWAVAIVSTIVGAVAGGLVGHLAALVTLGAGQ